VRAESTLLLVSLDDLGTPHVGVVRVTPGLAERATLAKKIPALVERDLELLQAVPIGIVDIAGRLALPELVLLGHQLLDPSVDRLVHLSPPPPNAEPARSSR